MNLNNSTDYDCLIIGGGLSGLACGITCLAEGLSCAILSSGMSALHFSSGSVDLLGYFPEATVVPDPFDALPRFIDMHSEHPYARCGIDTIKEALAFFRQEMARAGLPLHENCSRNHFHVTALGTLKPTFFSQRSVFNQEIRSVIDHTPAITIMNIQGFRDFHPGLAAANLKRHKLFSACDIQCAEMHLPEKEKNPSPVHAMRSIDIARIFDTMDPDEMARLIRTACPDADIVGLPAVLGIERHNAVLDRLRQKTGKIIYEVPTLPPSMPGMRLDNALKSRFAAMGGVFIQRETVEKGTIANGRVTAIRTKNQNDTLTAGFYVLSTGSFFSGGLVSRFDQIAEPVFNLALARSPEARCLGSENFFAPGGHAFLSAGVITDDTFHPKTPAGETVENLFCTGAVLSGYDPVNQGCGGGVAVATGYVTGRRIARGIYSATRQRQDYPDLP
ncbi:glycerol-3-phosphate dehydrogenase subunit GlpB [Desulfosudis oleivorans]|uniref:Glycerol-3-phosphate dehydrogenase n=1 Tax=Desulfosudis oleivorans (strain DSM 6200 / JCM 39069 / Hxd3) TaxID=96561 RepID=A8ZWX4_DESOH|nr:glycerol-3-phosphate dehydrogenase subunit GlpB [Desulfosudis oleivorans]ABW66830.1 Glycerol-3-phosphate dehydrogenase [Desulfosudis oleivorans Hxd3]